MDGFRSPTSREQRAARMSSRRVADSQLFAAAAAATAALEQFNQGVALIDRVCRVSFANALASAICRETDGLSLRAGELIATTKPDSSRLSQALKRAVGESQGASLRLERPSQRRPLSILITPLALPVGQKGSTAALVLINDPERSAAPPKTRLIQAYGLTSAEAGVAQLMLRGDDIAVVARRLCISIETARTHLRRVLAKTGTHRQSDLVLMLTREVGSVV